MISQISTPTFSSSRLILGRLQTENVTLAPKRSFAQREEDPAQELKRRHVRPDSQSSRRVPLDLLSASDLENRRCRRSHSADSRSHHSFVAPPFVPDLRALYPEQPTSSGYGATQPSGVSSAPICFWPPLCPSPRSGKSFHSNSVEQRCGLAHRSDVETTSRATYFESTSATWHPPLSDPLQTESTATMTKPIPTTGWKSENALQSVRPRTSSMSSTARPPAQLWRSDSAPIEAVDRPVHTVHLPTPPGLPPRRLELRRSGSDSNLLPHGSISLSLALGSQPLSASEHTKTVPPIGAERNRVVSMASPKPHIQIPPPGSARESSQPSVSPWCALSISSNLDPQPDNRMRLLNHELAENVHIVPGNVNVTKQDLERLLRHAIRNKHASKVVSPLSPLRTSASAVDLASDPDYRHRMPSLLNSPSPRYAKCPPRRARTVCDVYQSFDLDATCTHCQECKRDSVGKKLLAFRYRYQQTRLVQRSKPFLIRGTTNVNASAVGEDDRMVVANRIREVFAYEMDEEEKSLWEEVAAVTGAVPVSFSRVGAPCGAAAHRRSMDDGIDDADHDDNLEIQDDRLLGAESATLFRDVSVY